MQSHYMHVDAHCVDSRRVCMWQYTTILKKIIFFLQAVTLEVPSEDFDTSVAELNWDTMYNAERFAFEAVRFPEVYFLIFSFYVQAKISQICSKSSWD